jgi:O-antigen/teichoic acid export membrane protein
MIEAPPGRPVQNNPPQTLERFHIYLLLVLGIAFVGAGLVVLGFAGNSPVAVGIGAGAVVAAGFIAVFWSRRISPDYREKERWH